MIFKVTFIDLVCYIWMKFLRAYILILTTKQVFLRGVNHILSYVACAKHINEGPAYQRNLCNSLPTPTPSPKTTKNTPNTREQSHRKAQSHLKISMKTSLVGL